MIHVERIEAVEEPLEFCVIVGEDRSETKHEVTMAESIYQKLTGGKISPERCIQAAFQFLLDREPKESILSRFDMTTISKYFPDFERDFHKYL
ncbi:MAG: hypothetical protein EPO39_09090 [Candidatus Manganitrophaceae bacterium]|nr:MAG: hypothetical protein EPO39_09090 [Candidatus Manganitrophaceae bacterium]